MPALAALAMTITALAYGSGPAAAQEPDPSNQTLGLSANASWVTDLYDETLGRSPAESEVDFWVGRLAGGGAESRVQAARQFVYSPEGSGIEVDRAYADLLGRTPEAGGHTFWTNFLQSNPVTVLRSNLIASEEYYVTSGGTNGAWLRVLYEQVLARSVDAGGLAYWTARLEAGEPRWVVVWSVYLSPEALGNRADAYAEEILDRPLTPTERADAVNLIKAEDERAFRAQLLATDEAFEPYLEAVGLLGRK